ncbi:hypothetical protein pipiens_006155, partial [Culex pipiens pipiens]
CLVFGQTGPRKASKVASSKGSRVGASSEGRLATGTTSETGATSLSNSRQGSVDGLMQRCGLCSIISSLLRRAMCVGSRRGSGESYYQELAETNREAVPLHQPSPNARLDYFICGTDEVWRE